MRAHILGVGVTAPDIADFSELQKKVKQDFQSDVTQPLAKYSPTFLPANERRRTTATIKLALKTAEEALTDYYSRSQSPETQVPVVFISKDGDTFISARMCQTVADEEPLISPTQFHNSVHNAPAGYWMIGQQNQAPATAISAGEYSVANGLLEAVLQSQETKTPVLVVIYDNPLDELMPVKASGKSGVPFAFALVLEAMSDGNETQNHTLGLELKISSANQATLKVCDSDNPYSGVPAAEAYDLLSVLAGKNIVSEANSFQFALNSYTSLQVTLV